MTVTTTVGTLRDALGDLRGLQGRSQPIQSWAHCADGWLTAWAPEGWASRMIGEQYGPPIMVQPVAANALLSACRPDETAVIRPDGDSVRLIAGSGYCSWRCPDVGDWPLGVGGAAADISEVSAAVCDALLRLAPLASKAATLPALQCVWATDDALYVTDGYSLARLPIEGLNGAKVPAAPLVAARRIVAGADRFGWDRHRATLASDTGVLSLVAPGEAPPNVASIIDRERTEWITVDVDELKRAVTAVAALSEHGRAVLDTTDGATLVVSTPPGGPVVTLEVPADVHSAQRLVFGAGIILPPVAASRAQHVVISHDGKDRPVSIAPKAPIDGYLGIANVTRA